LQEETMDAELLLRRAGLRVTGPRRAVLEVLLGTEHALTPADLAAHPGVGEVDRVTVYRCLTALTAGGLAHMVSGVDGVSRYRAHDRQGIGCPGDHPHFLCTTCGGMWCLPGQRLPFVEVPEGARVDGKQLVVHGRCETCQGEEGG
jgi:Fur family ferric uptake transcriptional regulator